MRLTSKCDGQYFNNCFPAKIYNKLGQLEDIEDEFEIDDLKDLRDRLTTYKFLANHEMSCVDVNAYNLMLKDLDEYHKIEEELGIDLITLYKALKNGVYFRLLDYTKPTFKKIIIEPYHINIKKKYIDIRRDRLYDGFGNTGGHLYYFKDYGKTWALTKEELK